MPAGKVLEIACFNLESAMTAQDAGADRVELCENYKEGGVTPSQELIAAARRVIRVPLHVIIRPRGGDFKCSVQEINAMKASILFCKAQKIDGVVFGVLTAEQEVDRAACKALIESARPMSITFHRAIDSCKNIKQALEQLITLGVDRVLTSGGPGNAVENGINLKILQRTYGQKIGIMPGGGIRSSNVQQLLATGCHEYHSAAMTNDTSHADATEIKNLKHFLEKQH